MGVAGAKVLGSGVKSSPVVRAWTEMMSSGVWNWGILSERVSTPGDVELRIRHVW